MTEWRLKNGARLRFLRQYSQRRPVQSRGRPCALQACARSLFKNTNENKSDSITAGDLILAPISNLNPWFALHPGGGPWCGPTRNHFCSCRFPASVQLQLLVGMIYVHWRIAFHAQYLFSRWELRQKSRTAIPEHDYDTHDVGELWLQGGWEVEGGDERRTDACRHMRVMGHQPGSRLRKCGCFCDCDSVCHIQVTWMNILEKRGVMLRKESKQRSVFFHNMEGVK